MSKYDMHRITDVFYNVNMLEGAVPVVRKDGMFVVRNFVVMRAGLSANRNYYPVRTLRRDHKVFEGIQIRTDHVAEGGAPSIKDIVGKATNIRFSESDKTVRADAIFSSVEGDLVTKIKENLIGDMSINAFGTAVMEKGPSGKVQRRISAITSASSVDLVCEASAGGTLHEERRRAVLICERMVKIMDELGDVTLEELKKSRPDLVEAIKKEAILAASTEAVSTGATIDSAKIASSIEESVGKAVETSMKKILGVLEKAEQARKLTESIVKTVDEVIEESSMVEEAKPILRKSLTAFADTNFKTIELVDKAKLSEERDSTLKNLLELGKKVVENEDGNKKGGKGKSKEDKSRFKHSV